MNEVLFCFIIVAIIFGISIIANDESDIEMSKEVCEYINKAPCKLTYTYKPISINATKEETE